MYLNIMKNKKTWKTTLSICRGHGDANEKVKNTTIEYLSDLETLKNEYDGPISHFKKIVNKMNPEEEESKQSLLIKQDVYFRIPKNQLTKIKTYSSKYRFLNIDIDIYNLIKLADFYNTSCDYLLGIANISKPYKKNNK